jgi:succinyl-CoA synthetase alpha subunit
MLKKEGVRVNEGAESVLDFYLSLTIDRTVLSPTLIISTSPEFESSSITRLPFAYNTEKFTATSPTITATAADLELPESAHEKLAELVQALWRIYKEKEAFTLEARASYTDGSFEVRGARFGFDDAAFRSSGRQEEVHQLRDVAEEVPEQVEAERDGIVYVK